MRFYDSRESWERERGFRANRYTNAFNNNTDNKIQIPMLKPPAESAEKKPRYTQLALFSEVESFMVPMREYPENWPRSGLK